MKTFYDELIDELFDEEVEPEDYIDIYYSSVMNWYEVRCCYFSRDWDDLDFEFYCRTEEEAEAKMQEIIEYCKS